MQVEEIFFAHEGRRQRLLAAGSGRGGLVLWPGLGATAETFGRMLAGAAARGLRIAALDPPGHGRSEPLALRDGCDVARLLSGALEAAGLHRPALGGHSYGAVAVLAALAADPGLARRTPGVLLLDGGYLEHAETREERGEQLRRQLAEFTFAGWPEFLAAARRDAALWDDFAEAAARAQMVEAGGRVRLRVDPEACLEAMDLIARSGPQALGRVEVPRALLLRAGRPAELEAERAAGVAALKAKLPALEVRVVSDAAHELLDEAPKVVEAATWDFLARALAC